MLPIIIFPLFALYVCALEPPFAPAVVLELDRLGSLPSLISTNELLAGISPAELAAFLASVSTDTTNNSQPNPIAETFPNMTTGTINGSLVVLPLPYDVARAIIPSKYGILRQSIKAVLPFFPEDKYPLVLSTQIDHDIRSAGAGIPDFSSAQFRFPFIDLLGDGYSTFSYIPSIFISNNVIAIAGAQAYGEQAIASTFDPPHDPYASLPGGNKDGSIHFDVFRLGAPGPAVLNTTYRPHPGRYGEVGEYPLSFYTNVTNQPTFGCGNSTCLLTCDNMIRLFHTKITAGRFRPVGVSGSVSLAPAAKSGVTFFPRGFKSWNVRGVKLDVAFIENNYRNCNSLKGYQYMGI